MKTEERAMFRAELFERAAKLLRGEPGDPPTKAGEAAGNAAALAAPETKVEEGCDDGR